MNHPIKAMQQAVDVVLTSPHLENKVAAALFVEGNSLSLTNDWPTPILKKLGKDARIGDSSGTIHAEVNCLTHAKFETNGASLAITDPCCPNCAKCIAEAGIKTVYIDHKGFEKDFASRRGDDFQDMSLHILAHAGISIFEVTRKEGKIRELYKPEENYLPAEENPIEIRPCRESLSKETLLQTAKLVKVKHDRWACALAKDNNGKIWTLVASAHLAIGFTEANIKSSEGKYDFILEPINRILMGAARANLHLASGYIWCSIIPSPREMVNLVGAGFNTLCIGNMSQETAESSAAARKILEESGILKFEEMPL